MRCHRRSSPRSPPISNRRSTPTSTQLRKLIDERLKTGKTVDTAATFGEEEQQGGDVIDLMDALRRASRRTRLDLRRPSEAESTGAREEGAHGSLERGPILSKCRDDICPKSLAARTIGLRLSSPDPAGQSRRARLLFNFSDARRHGVEMNGSARWGTIVYGAERRIHVDDRTLAHIKSVVVTKLRRQESFTLSCLQVEGEPGSRISLWVHLDTAPVRVRHGGSPRTQSSG